MTQFENSNDESISKALLGGVVAALIGAIIQGSITAATSMNFGLVAIGIGYLTALGVRFMGNGNTIIYGIIGGVCALLGSLTGEYIATSLIVAKEFGRSWAEGFSFVYNAPSVMFESMGFMSWLFIALAGYFGFKYSIAEDK
jgi:hypothetical protein